MKTTTKEVKVSYKDGDKDKEISEPYSFEEMENIAECLEHAAKNVEEGQTAEDLITHRYNYNTERYIQQSTRNKLITYIDLGKKMSKFTGLSIEDSVKYLMSHPPV